MSLRRPRATDRFLSYPWPAGQLFFRAGSTAHPDGHVPYLGGPARFSPLSVPDPRDPSILVPVPTLYGAMPPADHRAGWTYAGALSESLFHDVPLGGGGSIDYRRIVDATLFTITPTRDLNLADLTTLGLAKLKLSNADMIERGPLIYPQTREWSAHIHSRGFDGITWMSRLHNPSRALMIFGDRVSAANLTLNETVPAEAALPLIEEVATALSTVITNRP